MVRHIWRLSILSRLAMPSAAPEFEGMAGLLPPNSGVGPLLVRHEALFDRTGVKGPRRPAVAAAGVKLEEA